MDFINKKLLISTDIDKYTEKTFNLEGDDLYIKQYKDALNGTTTWKDHIAQVKSDNPKPE